MDTISEIGCSCIKAHIALERRRIHETLHDYFRFLTSC